MKVLKNRESLSEHIKDSPAMNAKMLHMLDIYAKIQPLLYANRFLTDGEVDKVCALCDEYGTYYPQYFPELNIFRKVHELIITVPRFVKKYRIIGLLSEQSSESLYAAVKCEARSLSAVRSKTEQLRLQFVLQELRSNSSKDIIKRTVWLRGNEHSNFKQVFLRTGSGSERHCPLCEPNFFYY